MRSSRATKTNATEYITYHYSGGLVKEVHYDKNNLSTVLFTVHYQPGRMIIDVGGTETIYYTVTDTQGTMYKLLNGSGTVVANYNCDPFGLRISNSAPTIYMPLGFGGTYYDSETGFYFAQQRYYDPVTGRFTTKAPNLMAALLLQHRCLKGWKTTGPSSVILHMAPG